MHSNNDIDSMGERCGTRCETRSETPGCDVDCRCIAGHCIGRVRRRAVRRRRISPSRVLLPVMQSIAWPAWWPTGRRH